MRFPVAVVAFLLVGLLGGQSVHASEDVVAEPMKRLHDVRAKMKAALEAKDKTQLKTVRTSLLRVRSLFEKARMRPAGMLAGPSKRIARALDEIRARLTWCRVLLDDADEALPDLEAFESERLNEAPPDMWETPAPGAAPEDAGAAKKEPEREERPRPDPASLPKPAPGQNRTQFAREVMKRYATEEDPSQRALLVHGIGLHCKAQGLPTLFRLFDDEGAPLAREAIHDVLAELGGVRVAQRMRTYAVARKSRQWSDALDVCYRALEKPERHEPERPWQKTIRAFHKLKDRKLSVRIIEHLDGMGREGVAALGEIMYVDDFGYHDYTIGRLATKADKRAVPPLVHKMNRFKFEYRVQMPAHKALLQLGWHAVPELVNRLDNRAAGIWISWTLRKITGETMGTDKRKWHDWWKTERIRHPELFDDPDEIPTPVTPGR